MDEVLEDWMDDFSEKWHDMESILGDVDLTGEVNLRSFILEALHSLIDIVREKPVE